MARTIARPDLAIHADAVAELDWDPRFDPGELGVEVEDGVVILRGTVSSYAKIAVAEALVARVGGVRAVVNELEVRPQSTPDDVTLAMRARMALELDADVPNDRIECLIREGRLVLRGTVDHVYQRTAAERAVANLEGLRALEDRIEVRGHTRSDVEIERELGDALKRRVAWAEHVEHRVDNATVTLSGRVPTLRDRLDAEETAWRTRGVRHVIDHIVVSRG